MRQLPYLLVAMGLLGCNEIAPLPELPDVQGFVASDGGARGSDAFQRPDVSVGCIARAEVCDGVDNDCDNQIDEALAGIGMPCSVGEGACEGTGVMVCNAAGEQQCSAVEGSSSDEICLDGIDNDCDGEVDEALDQDNDGVPGCARCDDEDEICLGRADCNDTNRDIVPGAFEPCDGIDNDCDGRVDEGHDEDEDGFPGCGLPCTFEGEPALCHADCQPNNPDAHPAVEEVCNGVDDNCNGEIDEHFSSGVGSVRRYDRDATCGDCSTSCLGRDETHNTVPRCISAGVNDFRCSPECLTGYFDVDNDTVNGCECRAAVPNICDDTAANNGRCTEVCDDVDNDCDGRVDENDDMATPGCWPGDPAQRNVGACRDGHQACEGGRLAGHICRNAVLPDVETCNAIDDDCDGRVDEDLQEGRGCQTGLPGDCGNGTTACNFGAVDCIPIRPECRE